MKKFIISFGFLLAFVLWTVLVLTVDRAPIGPNGSFVGLSGVNGAFHSLTGSNLTLYNITDWAGLVPVFCGFSFAVLGLIQWVKRKNIIKVDKSLLVLGIYYIVVLCLYLFFEEVVISYRPVLIGGYLEASYPSSTTLLVLTVMPTTKMQLASRIKNKHLKQVVSITIFAFCFFVVLGRLISGVHWLSDIIGGILLSFGLVWLYKGAVK